MCEIGSHGVNFEQFLKIVCMEGGRGKGSCRISQYLLLFFQEHICVLWCKYP